MLLVPSGSVSVDYSLSTLVRNAATITESDGSVDDVKANVPLVKEKVHLTFLIKLDGDVD